jgi:hypothetical protein
MPTGSDISVLGQSRLPFFPSTVFWFRKYFFGSGSFNPYLDLRIRIREANYLRTRPGEDPTWTFL